MFVPMHTYIPARRLLLFRRCSGKIRSLLGMISHRNCAYCLVEDLKMILTFSDFQCALLNEKARRYIRFISFLLFSCSTVMQSQAKARPPAFRIERLPPAFPLRRCALSFSP
mmetsp:Transcript_36223/g.108545  ORF Transcript_36223/g.108545 Transcript_36223/m.108545 type:complete len:112 (-) Transcript_36223:455-790(-)